MSLGSQVRKYRTQLGWTLEELESRSGVGRGTISALENRGSNKSEFASKLASAFGLTVEQLADEPRNWLDEKHVGLPPQAIFDVNTIPASIGGRRIPLLNYVQAGIFTDIGSNFPTEDMEYLLTDLALSDRAFALQIKGESMLPDFKEGDRIIVDCDVCPRPGDFVVAKNTTEEATFKKYRLVRVDDKGQEVFELIPLNNDYPTVRSDQQHLHIIGTMVEHRKYFRR